jgi:hypothetical protein
LLKSKEWQEDIQNGCGANHPEIYHCKWSLPTLQGWTSLVVQYPSQPQTAVFAYGKNSICERGHYKIKPGHLFWFYFITIKG